MKFLKALNIFFYHPADRGIIHRLVTIRLKTKFSSARKTPITFTKKRSAIGFVIV
jgi:hypothetical protein